MASQWIDPWMDVADARTAMPTRALVMPETVLVMLVRPSVRGTRNAMFEWCNLRGKRLLDELVEVAAEVK